MELTINLRNKNQGTVVGGAFYIPTETSELILNFALPRSAEQIGELYVNLQLNDKEACHRVVGKKLLIPQSFLENGILAITAVLMSEGVELMRWSVEPLRIIEFGGDVTAMPKLTELEERIQALETLLQSHIAGTNYTVF